MLEWLILGKKILVLCRFKKVSNLVAVILAEGGWKLKLTRVSAAEYEIYVTKYLLV